MDAIRSAVEKYKDMILEAERYIWKNPETGYKEYKTNKYMAEQFEKLGYKLTYADGITGFYTVIDTGREGPEVLVLGELDSVICANHKEADPETGAVHSCGHNVQAATLLGIAAALTDEKVLEKLCGRIRLCAVPAEELLEIDFRTKLREQGKISYFGGKTEFLHRGYFDGVDIAFMVHASSGYRSIKGHVGCIAKKVVYKGVAAHAGGSPWNGKNALYAATCGINAANALRETFKEDDVIRFHPIITNGGQMVNAIPEMVTIESYVRGKSFDAIVEANKKINRALCGAALSVGTNIEIIDIPGYAPGGDDPNMTDVAADAAEMIIPERNFVRTDSFSSGSTDMGDLSLLMPTAHLYSSGTEGTSHGADYYVTDPIAACVDSAKWQVAILTLLLGNNAERAKKIIAEFEPAFKSKDEYLSYIEAIRSNGDRIVYNEDSAEVRL